MRNQYRRGVPAKSHTIKNDTIISLTMSCPYLDVSLSSTAEEAATGPAALRSSAAVRRLFSSMSTSATSCMRLQYSAASSSVPTFVGLSVELVCGTSLPRSCNAID